MPSPSSSAPQDALSRACRDVVTGLRAASRTVESWTGMTDQLLHAGAGAGFAQELEQAHEGLQRAVAAFGVLLRPAGVPERPVVSSPPASPPGAAGTPAGAPAEPEIPEVDEDGGRCVLSATGPGFSIPGLMEFLSQSGRTGTLHVATGRNRFLLRLVGGELVHAESTWRPSDERLGEILIQQGAVSPERMPLLIELATAADGEAGLRLGQVLEREGLVDPAHLRAALTEQIRRLFARLFASAGVWFAFYEGKPSYPDLHVQLDLMRLLLDSARQHDELEASAQR